MKKFRRKFQFFLKRILRAFTFRRIQFDIIFTFIVLISASSLVIIIFTYSKNSAQILKVANLTMKEASADLLDKIDDITSHATFLDQTSRAFIKKSSDVSYNNQELVSFILDILKYSTYITAMRIGTPEGNLLAGANIALSNVTHFHNNPSKLLPKGTVYTLRYVEHVGEVANEVWQYYNKDMELLDKEVTPFTTYDPRNETWYSDTLAVQYLHWSNTYLNLLGEPGITVAGPAINAEGKLTSVVALNLSLNLLTQFLTRQHVGTSGSSFILDEEGKIIVPPVQELLDSSEGKLLYMIPDIFQQFSKSGENNFIFEKDKIKYLVFISHFPLSLETTWNILFMVPFDEFFHSISETQKQIIIISIIVTIVFGILVYISSKRIGAPIVNLVKEVQKIQHFDFSENPIANSDILEIIELDKAINSMRKAIHSFERYVPKEIVKVLLQQGREIAVGGEKKNVTIFFSDIVDFATFSETISVEKLLDSLTEYFEAFSKIVIECDGTIDKYIGDSMMAMWNAPQTVADHPDKACLAALRCLVASRKQQQESGKPGWNTLFSLHTGEVIVGNIGTKERVNYTAIGDVVNTAARLYGVNKTFQTSIIISETLQRKIGTQFLTRPLDTVSVKGKKNEITVYELVGLLKGDLEFLASQDQIELCNAFAIAYGRFQEGQLEEAKGLFLNILKHFPRDKPTQIYLERIEILKV